MFCCKMDETITDSESIIQIKHEPLLENTNLQSKAAISMVPVCRPMPAVHDYPQPEICNIMATFNVNCKLDLKKIALRSRNSIYCPKRFAALNLKMRNPNATAMIFNSGKVICMGTRAEDVTYFACRRFARIIQKFEPKAKFRDFKVRMLSGLVNVNFTINLDGMYMCHQQFISFEPELFPGLVYKMLQPKVTLVIYVTGKIVITGCKERKEVYDAFEKLFPVLKLFKKKS